MLELITSTGNVGIHDIDNRYCITHKYNGVNTLHFEVSREDPIFDQLVEEALIYETTEGQTYIVKGIDAGPSYAEIDCELCLDEWRSTAYLYYYNNTSSIGVTMDAVVPDGWSMAYDKADSQRRSVNLDWGGTPMDIALAAQDSYGCAMQFDTAKKTCTVYYPQSNPVSDMVLTESANMRRRPDYIGKSTELVTRIYPVGADGLTIESVNGGKGYVECHDYTDKVICQVWRDERYEDAQSLKDDAKALVNSLAVPAASWEVQLVDLYRADPHQWPDHRLGLYQRVTVQYGRKTITALVAEETIYPHHPELNEIAINSVAANAIHTISGLAESISNPNSAFNSARDAAIANATKLIAGSRGGHVITVLDDDGRPSELCVLEDSDDISTAMRLWRWNAGGLGHSTNGYNGPFALALTKDGAIVADRITAGILNAAVIKAGILGDKAGKNYWNMETGEFALSAAATVGGSTVSAIAGSAASGAASSALTSAKKYTDSVVDTYDDALNQAEIFNRLTNNGQTQGIYLKDGRIYINGTYVRGTMFAGNNMDLAGKFKVYDGPDGVMGGYVGYMQGSDGVELTDGIGVSDATGECYVIATNAGVRMQAGSTRMYINKNGPAVVDGNLIIKNGTLTYV